MDLHKNARLPPNSGGKCAFAYAVVSIFIIRHEAAHADAENLGGAAGTAILVVGAAHRADLLTHEEHAGGLAAIQVEG